MEKKLIKFNQGSHENELRNANTDLKAYNKLLKGLQPLALANGVTLDMTAFAALLKNPKEFAFDAIVGNAPLTIAGVTVNKNKAMDLIEMPDAWLKTISLVDAFNRELNKTPEHIPHRAVPQVIHIGLDSFELLNDEFVLSTKFIEELKNRHSVFTVSENQNAALKHITEIHTSLMALQMLGVPFSAFMTFEQFGYGQSGGGMSNTPTVFSFDPAVVVSQVN